MNRNLRHFLKLLWQSVAFWTPAIICFGIFRYYGIEEEEGITVRGGFDGGKTFFQPMLIFSLLGFGLGILYALVDFFFERYKYKKMALGLDLLIKSILHFVVTIFFVTVIRHISSGMLNVDFNPEPGWWHYDKRFWIFIFYVIISSLVFSFIRIATERFGKDTFLKMLIGKYKEPREEERIFMFLDLKDSTTIAETLGHFKYSQFIQDCFLDLNKVVLKYDAEIYQYVGDEVVLSWPYKKGIENNNCLGLFFAFQEKRQSRSVYYKQKYGVYPVFKAGLHGGVLMVAEVGFVKKELAYHGDVINTSARIQGECNSHNVNLLLSEKVLTDLKIDEFSISKSMGDVLLKGKHKKIKIHTIEVT
jgi:adenylate cyclase